MKSIIRDSKRSLVLILTYPKASSYRRRRSDPDSVSIMMPEVSSTSVFKDTVSTTLARHFVVSYYDERLPSSRSHKEKNEQEGFDQRDYHESKITDTLFTPEPDQTTLARTTITVMGDFQMKGGQLSAERLRTFLQKELEADAKVMGHLNRYGNTSSPSSSGLTQRLRKRFIDRAQSEAPTQIRAYIDRYCPGVDCSVDIEKKDEDGSPFATEDTAGTEEDCRVGLTVRSREVSWQLCYDSRP